MYHKSAQPCTAETIDMLMRSESPANQSMLEPHMKGNRLTIASGSDMFSRVEEY